jgi:hypothetical protein
MVVVLQSLDGTTQAVDGLEIRAVEDQASLRTWVEVFTKGFNVYRGPGFRHLGQIENFHRSFA